MQNIKTGDSHDNDDEVTGMLPVELIECEKVAYINEMRNYLHILKNMPKPEAKRISHENLVKSKIITEDGCFTEQYEFEETYKKVLYEHAPLRPSHNSYDWLGNEIYFWENSLSRAEEWAVSYCKRYNKKYPNKEKKNRLL